MTKHLLYLAFIPALAERSPSAARPWTSQAHRFLVLWCCWWTTATA